MSEYDAWKTDPEYGLSDKDLKLAELSGQLIDAMAEQTRLEKENAKLRDALEEILEEAKDNYDVDPDPTGGIVDIPNRWMRLGTMIEEVLHGPGYVG